MITLNFDEVLERTYNAKKGVEVRYGLGQGFEYCKQFADEAQGYATSAKASEKKATDAVAGIEQTKTDAVQAVQNAQTTATTAVTTKQTEAVRAVGTAQTGAVQAVDDERDAALQQVANSTKTAQTAASNAAASKQAAQASKEAAATSAKGAASSATAASGSARAAATSESNAASSAENSEASAARSEAAAKKAEAVVSTDKTLAVSGAPADAAATGAALSKKLDLTGGTMTGPLILADGYNAYGVASNAAAHNAMPPRFKNLGTAATSDIHAAIKAGTFDDIFVGDYFMVGNNPIYFGAFDWYLNCGDTSCSEHHALLVPGNNLYTYHMNATDTTEGGYVGSDMYKNGLTQAKQFFSDAFGAAHILNHRQHLVNAVTNGKPTGSDWYDSTVELMNECMVYGGRQFSPMPDGHEPWNTCRNYTIDKSQLPLFRHASWLICNRSWYWLRDVVSTGDFADIDTHGTADYASASYARGVRPVAGLIG